MSKIIDVLVADDRPSARADIRASLAVESDLSLIGEATTNDETRRLCQKLQPDVLLLATSLATPSLREMLVDLQRHCPATKILILADECTDICRVCIPRIMAAGSYGCLLKDGTTSRAVVIAIRNAMQGMISFRQLLVEKLIQEGTAPALAAQACLTKREVEVLQLIARGLYNRTIAGKLGITERTVEFHVSNILGKLRMPSRVEAAVWAIENNII
jgi:DNA-binding NarL/FixJ family response regulator